VSRNEEHVLYTLSTHIVFVVALSLHNDKNLAQSIYQEKLQHQERTFKKRQRSAGSLKGRHGTLEICLPCIMEVGDKAEVCTVYR
jgi:hypothetical protein